jgi:hypothetical protein
MDRPWPLGLVVVAAAVALASCGRNPAPSAPSTTATAASSPSQPSSFTVDLPIAPGDAATAAYGIWPFGVHGSSHAADGHPGFDVEFVPGASVRAAADGVVANVSPDPNASGRFNIRIGHANSAYATDYTNVGPLAAGIAPGANVARGQALGTAGIQTQLIGAALVTWAMTHFQVNDFSRNQGLTNPNAVSPELWLSPAGRTLFDVLWARASYAVELTEPFATNDRGTVFPLTRTWTAAAGAPLARFEITRADPLSNDETYVIRSAGAAVLESGSVIVTPRADLSTIDLVPQSGAARLGVFDIVSASMRLNLGEPGAPRPGSLDGARVYTTQ